MFLSDAVARYAVALAVDENVDIVVGTDRRFDVAKDLVEAAWMVARRHRKQGSGRASWCCLPAENGGLLLGYEAAVAGYSIIKALREGLSAIPLIMFMAFSRHTLHLSMRETGEEFKTVLAKPGWVWKRSGI